MKFCFFGKQPLENHHTFSNALINKGYQEHDKGDQMVLAIKSISPNESEFKEKVRELQEFMLNHLEEEEKELFPEYASL